MNKKKNLSVVITICALICMCMIYYYSSQDADKSNGLSRGIAERVSRFVMMDYDSFDAGMQETIIFEINAFIRKAAHFTIFCMTGIFVYAALFLWFGRFLKSIFITMGVCVLYACFDEFHQSYVSGRTALIKDVIIDSCGAMFGIGLCCVCICVISFIRIKLREKNSSFPHAAN